MWATCLESKPRCTLQQSVLYSAYDSQVSRDYSPRIIKALILIIQTRVFLSGKTSVHT